MIWLWIWTFGCYNHALFLLLLFFKLFIILWLSLIDRSVLFSFLYRKTFWSPAFDLSLESFDVQQHANKLTYSEVGRTRPCQHAIAMMMNNTEYAMKYFNYFMTYKVAWCLQISVALLIYFFTLRYMHQFSWLCFCLLANAMLVEFVINVVDLLHGGTWIIMFITFFYLCFLSCVHAK